jgi:putative inorganic carbon (hco3(-)) transporter
MRDIVLLVAILFFLGVALRYPFAGLLTWGWLTIMNPHMMVYGFALGWPFNFAVALVTVAAWLLAGGKRRWPGDGLPWLMVALVVWMTFDSLFAVDPDWSWPLWQRTVKIYAFIFLCLAMIDGKARLHAMVWVMVISIGFFGAKGGVFTVLKGGAFHVYGPDNTIIRDNNHLALAVVMTLPLAYYLFLHSRNRWLRLGIGLTFPLQIATILGSYSRGGLIALAVVLGFFWLRSRRKVLQLVIALVLAVGALQVMPPAFFDRVKTIDGAQTDESFQGRLTAWSVAYQYAADHFPLGAGFAGPQLKAVYNYYYPNAETHAAHSIYFQVLGEHGFPALFLYLLIAALSLRNTRMVIKRCRGRPELAWAGDLASMVEVSLVGFYVGGAALSMAYYDGFLLLQAFTSILRGMVEPAASPRSAMVASQRPAPGR